MKVHIYTDLDMLFGRAARIWMDVLLEAGHEVEFVDLGADTKEPLPELGPCDLNLLVVGIFAYRRFAQQGLPAHGRHLLWMFDPLTRDAGASVHHPKTLLFDAIAPQLHGVMGMNDGISEYVKRHFPAVAAFELPYLIAEKHIRVPLADAGRTRQVLMLGSDTPRRRQAEQAFASHAGLEADFIWTNLWGQERDNYRAQSRLSLQIHADAQHTYFDQFRAFETWAAGTPVVSDRFEGWEEFGLEPGRHLLMADVPDLPALCQQLLADAPRREAMAADCQALLRERFSPAAWRERMLAMAGEIGLSSF